MKNFCIIDPEKEQKICIDIKRWESDMARNDLCFCGSGKKQKKCHSDVHEDSIFANLLRVTAALEKERNKKPNKCVEGCHDCCSDYFNISIAEFFAILNHLKIGGEKHELNRYIWQAREALKGVVLPDGNDDRIKIPNYPMCIFVDDTDGKCKIYSVRPLLCRMYGDVSDITNCEKIINDNNAKNALIEIETVKNNIDVLTNIDYYNYNGQKYNPKMHPIIYWFANLDEAGELRAARMKDLFKVFGNSSANEFIRILIKN